MSYRPLKRKRLTTFCASLALLHLLLSLTHWIFRSLTLPYKSSSHSAKCVRCASLRSGGRRLAVRTAMDHPIGALPRTPFPASRDFPSRGNERYGEKNRASYTSCTILVCPPLVAGATTFPPQAGALWVLSNGIMSLQESIECFILFPGWGKVRRSRIGGSRSAAIHNPQHRRRCRPLSGSEHNPSTQPAAEPRPLFL